MKPRAYFQSFPVLLVCGDSAKLTTSRNMKMLFFSSDKAEVEQLSEEFEHAGIPCEVHNAYSGGGLAANESELWIRNDQDCHRALMLCVQLNMGFARRPVSSVDEMDYDAEPVLC